MMSEIPPSLCFSFLHTVVGSRYSSVFSEIGKLVINCELLLAL